MPKAEKLTVGETVETLVVLPGIPLGSIGEVAEVRALFIAVRLPEGRTGYYAARQLQRRKPAPSPPKV